jgi:cell division protein FtsL
MIGGTQANAGSGGTNDALPTGKFWLLFLILLALVSSTALGVVYTTFTSRHLLNTLQQLEKQRNRLQVEWGQLLLEQSSLVAQGRVEDTAIAELGMEVPDMKQVVVFKSD